METKGMIEMPKIMQFKNVIREVKHQATFIGTDQNNKPMYNRLAKLPTLKYQGTIKLHGANGAIVYNWKPDEHKYSFHVQSRNGIITPTHDSLGFAKFIYGGVDTNALLDIVMKSVEGLDNMPKTISIFGEWCGGNIQGKVALSRLKKMFVIFAVQMDDIWIKSEFLKNIKIIENQVYNILDYQCFEIEIDFENPQLATNKLNEFTLEVEKECPVAKAFGVSGIGEGIVWRCIDNGYTSSNYWFKVKGEDHTNNGKNDSNDAKSTNLAPVDVQRFENINALVESIVTERRLEQGIEYLNEKNIKVEKQSIGIYIKWIMNDIVSEELTTITENGFRVNDIASEVTKKARNYMLIKLGM